MEEYVEDRYRCVRCEGLGYREDREGDRLVRDPCLHCNGKGCVSYRVASVDRHEALCETIAYARVDAQRKACNENPEGEGWAFHAAENMMHEHEYTQARIWETTGIVQDELKALSYETLNALCDLLDIDMPPCLDQNLNLTMMSLSRRGMMKATVPRILAEIEKVRSMSEGRRLVVCGHVAINGVVITDISQEVSVTTGDIITVGKTEVVVPAGIAEKNDDAHSDVSTNQDHKDK